MSQKSDKVFKLGTAEPNDTDEKFFKALAALNNTEEMFSRYDDHVNVKVIAALKKVTAMIMK